MRLPVRESVRAPIKLHPLGRAVASVVRRNFMHLAGVNQYFYLPSIVLPGDFELTLKTTLPESGGYFLSDRFSSDAYQRLGLTADGRLFGMLSDGAYGVSASHPTGVLKTIQISRSGSTISAYLDGNLIYSRQSSRVFVINSIGAPYSGSTSISHFGGVVQSFHVSGDNFTSGGEPVDELFYPLDDSPDNFPVIREAVNGKNGTFINGSVDAYGEFIEQENGDLLSDNIWVGSNPLDVVVSSYDVIERSDSWPGMEYQASFDYESDEQFRYRLGGTIAGLLRGAGRYSSLDVAGAGSVVQFQNNGSSENSIKISNILIQCLIRVS